jgi:hypothetical protein
LRGILRILRAQRPYLKGNEQRKQACREGIRFWRERYAELLIKQVRDRWAEGEWQAARKAMKALLRVHPEALTGLWTTDAS